MEYKKKVLNNGLRLLTAKKEGLETVTILVLCKVGSKNEDDKNRGISHFVEHMMFKGTEKRPTNMEISKALDSVGADYNAFTMREMTGYYVKVGRDQIDLAMDVLSDMVFNSKFDAEELEREKGVILEEVKMYEENPLMYLEDVFEELVFSGNRLGQMVIGTRSAISSFTRDNLVVYQNGFYQFGRIAVAVAGSFDDNQVEQLVDKYFVKQLAARNIGSASEYQRFNPELTASDLVSIFYKDSEQVQLGLGFLGLSNRSDQTSALTLFNVILGGNMSSRLFNEVREKRGLAYSIYSRSEYYEDAGCLYAQAGVAKDKLDEAIKVIVAEFNKLKTIGVSAEELNMAKEFIRGKMSIQLEDSSELATWFARQELLYPEVLTPEERINKILAVQLDEANNLAKELIKEDSLRLALIGPFTDKEYYTRLIKL